jgi:hypothetical protein
VVATAFEKMLLAVAEVAEVAEEQGVVVQQVVQRERVATRVRAPA